MTNICTSCFDIEGNCVSASVSIPMSFVQRARGLLGRKSISSDESMLFYNCSSIHMFGMRFPIDVVFLDTNFQIVKLVEHVKPWRLTSSKDAQHTLELASGCIAKHGLAVGNKLMINESIK